MPSQFYFKGDDNLQHVLNDKDEYLICDRLPKHRKDSNVFCCFKGYDDNEAGLREYKKDFKLWVEQLKRNGILSIWYETYPGHNLASYKTFKRLNGRADETHKDRITPLENSYWDKCNNGGLIYCCEPRECDSYGYDFSSFYPSLMADKDFLIPTTEGYETTLKKLPKRKNLKLGIYHVKIQSDNKHFRKLFAVSASNMYTNYSLQFAMKYQKKYDVSIELIEDNKPNAYLYDNTQSGYELFGNWYETLRKIKQKHPKNKLIKHLLSSLWGFMSSQNVVYKSEKEVEEKNIKIGNSTDITKIDYQILDFIDNDKSPYYKLLDLKRPYNYNVRLKPFLTSYARLKVAEVAKKNVKHVIRIHTDGIVYDKPIEHNIPNLIPEDKTTGRIKWINANRYERN